MKNHLATTLPMLAFAATTLFAQDVMDAAVLQKAIDAAAPGAVLEVAAGIYQGSITLKDGVFLAGAGADLSIIEGTGKGNVVRGAKDAALMGFTIRNGERGIHNDGAFLGLFECEVRECSTAAVHVELGSAALVNNVIRGVGVNRGILCVQANPLISHNVIMQNQIGIQVMQEVIPTIQDNVIVSNTIGILLNQQSKVVLGRNVFDGNGENVRGQELAESDVVRTVTPGELAGFRGGKVEQYRTLMAEVKEKSIAAQPMVIYQLHPTPAQFDVITLYPWATFTVGASAVNTTIKAYDAFDRLTDADLAARYFLQQNVRPSVAVENAQLKEQGLDRYSLAQIYEHPESYFGQADGTRVFQRETNMTRIKVVLPAGYEIMEANLPYTLEHSGSQQVLAITDMGWTRLRVTMKPR